MQLRRFLLHIAIVIGLLCFLSFTFLYKVLPSVTNKDQVVSVPNVQGMTIVQAERFLKERDLRVEVIDSSFDAAYPPLTVLYQYPKANSKVKIFRKISLKLNAFNPPKIAFPDLDRTTLDFARTQLEILGLKLGSIQYKQDIAHNAVLGAQADGHVIHAGDPIKKGSTVALIVGTRNQQFACPDFTGLRSDEIQFAILSMDLTPAIHYTTSDTSRNVVIRQSPLPNDTVTVGDQIDIWLGRK